MENRNNSAAIWAIFAKFGVMVDMEVCNVPQRPFLTCVKIQDVGRPKSWKKENHHISAVVSDIFTKFGVLLVIGSPHHPLVSFLDYNKIQDGGRRHFEIAENRQYEQVCDRSIFVSYLGLYIYTQAASVQHVMTWRSSVALSSVVMEPRTAYDTGYWWQIKCIS